MTTILISVITPVALFIIGVLIKLFSDIASLKTNVDNLKEGQREIKEDLLKIRSEIPTIIHKTRI